MNTKLSKKMLYSCLALISLNMVGIVNAFAAEGEAVTSDAGSLGIGAGIAIGLAALGGTLGQGKTVSALLDSTGRNPGASGKLFVPMILGLVFIESLVILSFVIAFQLIGKL